MSADIARRVVAHGRVQGVFFRDSCRTEAREAGVRGWVTNAADGTVEAHLEGPADAVDRLVAWIRHGPPHADVERVDVQDASTEDLAGFEIR
jgi:acylphosphatase